MDQTETMLTALDPRDRPAAVLLAAGRGSRMGRSKPLLPWGGRTLLEAWAERFLDAGLGPVAVVVGADAALVRGEVGLRGLHWAVNEDAARTGPRESLLLGLDALPEGRPAFFTPVDVPVVGAELVEAMLAAWREALAEGTEPLAVLPERDGRTGHPVLAGPRLIERLFQGERGDRIDALLQWSGAGQLRVPTEDDRAFANMNTPEDYGRWRP